MADATQAFHNRLVLVFDFDDTLATSTYHFMLDQLGIDDQEFEDEEVQPLLDEGWEKSLARGQALIELSRSDRIENPITEERMEEIALAIPYFDGVPEMFRRVEDAAQAIVEDMEVEFYLLTAGFAEIPNAVSIAGEFEAVYGGAFGFDEETGEIKSVKRIITRAEKPQYLQQIAKGLPLEGANPTDVYRPIPEEDYHVPFDQMIYVGDGGSDMAAFAFMRDRGGLAIGVHAKGKEPDEWRGQDDIYRQRRLQNLAPADYRKDSELYQSLIYATESISKLIALRRLGAGK